ncbi:MAG: aspartate--ammonia ligase [Angelakisella sp.]
MTTQPTPSQRRVIIPDRYLSKLDVLETEIAIKLVKDTFERELAKALHLTRVSAPLFVRPETGLNDDLNGIERPVQFDILDIGADVQIVQSLAKWKRMALQNYGFAPETGLYTDMNAIRRDEELDNLHSVYVDQWDWELVITREQRTTEMLMDIVNKIWTVFVKTQRTVCAAFPVIASYLPEQIAFISSQELEDSYPLCSPKEREDIIAKKHGAVFISQIGGALKSGQPHDGRAPDYDDWSMNGDILIWYEPLGRAVELSSMGIRVDREALEHQLAIRGQERRKSFPFHRMLLEDKLPLTMGGGIGQSRICMTMLEKVHLGEVQASVWPDDMIAQCEAHGVHLL